MLSKDNETLYNLAEIYLGLLDLIEDENWIKGYLKGTTLTELLEYALDKMDLVESNVKKFKKINNL